MEFTKTEQRILSPKHEQMGKWALWLGILFICFSIGRVLFAINTMDTLSDIQGQSYALIDREMKAETKREVFLKSMLLRNMRETKELYATHIRQKAASEGLNSFLVSCLLIGSYFVSRIYRNLIHKLQNPNKLL